VDEAHDITDKIERGLSEAVSGLEAIIHVEPENEAKAHGGIRVG